MLGTSCTSLTGGDASAPVSIEFVTSHAPPDTVEEFDTVVVSVRVRNRAGDTIPNAPRQLISLAPDTVGIDTVLLGLIGLRPGAARVLAVSGKLRSDPLPVVVVRAPDSLALVGPSPDTVPAADSASDSLRVRLLDLRTDTTQALGLVGHRVTFTIVLPVFASASAATAVLGNDSLSASVPTVTGTLSGVASVIVKRRGPPPQPDSVVVQASATRAVGTAVHGSPVRFVVFFQ
jgi:hypothetical protein